MLSVLRKAERFINFKTVAIINIFILTYLIIKLDSSSDISFFSIPINYILQSSIIFQISVSTLCLFIYWYSSIKGKNWCGALSFSILFLCLTLILTILVYGELILIMTSPLILSIIFILEILMIFSERRKSQIKSSKWVNLSIRSIAIVWGLFFFCIFGILFSVVYFEIDPELKRPENVQKFTVSKKNGKDCLERLSIFGFSIEIPCGMKIKSYSEKSSNGAFGESIIIYNPENNAEIKIINGRHVTDITGSLLKGIPLKYILSIRMSESFSIYEFILKIFYKTMSLKFFETPVFIGFYADYEYEFWLGDEQRSITMIFNYDYKMNDGHGSILAGVRESSENEKDAVATFKKENPDKIQNNREHYLSHKIIKEVDEACEGGIEKACEHFIKENEISSESISKMFPDKKTSYGKEWNNFSTIESACFKGIKQACDILEVPADLKEMRKHSVDECEKGNVAKCEIFISMVYKGIGGEKDKTLKFKYQKKSCELLNVKSCLGIGNILSEGKEVPLNCEEAVKYYTIGCDNSYDGGTCMSLGHLWKNGKGCKIDLEKAAFYYKKSCEKGESISCKYYDEVIEEIKK